ncbi:DUF370 domain-containing protein [Aciduricibacillus chroicocephali]|uniref:DUF370 domain-containing protein n=1 Tax=Aciduricibacillus chroicocephali TaxID=3054939 RepID=A0ABY9KVU3_9BACI|nr:DUF370 domain-containing protein [Bacillaceae bacterium 44XB]
MFVHIGGNHVIQSDSIVSIIERDLMTSSGITGEMISESDSNGMVHGSPSDAKSIVITIESIYFSTLSVATLQRRASMISTISKLEDYSDEIELD